MIIRLRSQYVTSADRARMAARQAEHVDTYGTRRPLIVLPFTGRQLADLFAVVFVAVFLTALVVGYVSDVTAVADMCAEVFSQPTDHIPAECASVSTR